MSSAGDRSDALLVGVDAGTGSARAGVLTLRGDLLGAAEAAMAIRRDGPDIAEQDSEDVWRAVCVAVRGALAEAGADGARVAALGFGATCSLVMRTAGGEQLGVRDGDRCWDTILWLDHRARAEAAEIDGTGDPWVAICGGAVSPEMQAPKALWLKRRQPEIWACTGLLLDLCDFLTWRATGSTARSACALVCKWPWIDGWRDDLLARVGLSDLRDRGGLPERGVLPGSNLGAVTPRAAAELGVSPQASIGAGLIDAHAAALSMLAGRPSAELALIAGTSTCVMGFSNWREARPGLWGPHRDAVLPGQVVMEGGQSAAGALLDHLIRRFGGVQADAAVHDAVAARIGALRAIEGDGFAVNLHVLPDFHGNRSPTGRPGALGAISGLPLEEGFDGLCRIYWRACVALSLELREIVEALAGGPANAVTLHFSGGHARSTLLGDLYRDVIGCALVPHGAREAALRGAAATAATAAGLAPDLATAAAAMARPRPAIPSQPLRARHYDRDLAALLLMRDHRRQLDGL